MLATLVAEAPTLTGIFTSVNLNDFVTIAKEIVPIALTAIVPILGIKFGVRFLTGIIAGL